MPPIWKGVMSAPCLAAGMIASGCASAPAGALTFAGSMGYGDYSGPLEEGGSERFDRCPVDGAFLIDFSQGFDSATQSISDWLMDLGWLTVDFSRHNARFDRNGMTLSVTRRSGGPTPYVSAEFERKGFYGFGRYEVVMKSAKMPGVVSSFFTHTDAYLGDPHSEVDFEFTGGKTRELHTNYFWEGQPDALDIPLWFDASEGFHLYAFEWAPEQIVWFVDGVEVRRVHNATASVPVPTTPSRVMANIWAANKQALEWVGEPEGEGASATYLCMSHVPAGQTGRQCSDSFTPPR